MNDTLTDKQIANLRKVVRHRWIPWFMLSFGAFLIFAAVMKVLFVHKIWCQSGLTRGHVLALMFSGPKPAETYTGVEVLVAGGIQDALLYLVASALFILQHFALKQQHRKDKLVLKLIDREQTSHPEKS